MPEVTRIKVSEAAKAVLLELGCCPIPGEWIEVELDVLATLMRRRANDETLSDVVIKTYRGGGGLDAQIERDAREECRLECGCGDFRAHQQHIRQDSETMALYRGIRTLTYRFSHEGDTADIGIGITGPDGVISLAKSFVRDALAPFALRTCGECGTVTPCECGQEEGTMFSLAMSEADFMLWENGS